MLVRLVLRRLGLGLLTLWAVTVLIFAATEILPGDVASAILGQNRTPEALAAIRDQLGLDRPAPVRYVEWLADFARGDLGTSLANGRPIAPDVGGRLANTLFLTMVAALIAVPLAVGLGLLAAIHQNRLFDRLASTLTLVTVSLPEFFIGYLLIMYVSVRLGLFPSLAMVNPAMGLGERLYAVALPVTTLVVVVIAHMMRMTRAVVIGVMASPYVEMAVLKGLPPWRVVIQHALPNALAPIVNVVAVNVAYLIVGVVVVEVVFVYPGMGQMMVDAVYTRDVPVVQACGLVFAGAYVLLNIVADLVSILANPRLRYPR